MPYSKTTKLKGACLEVAKERVTLIYKGNAITLPMLSGAPNELARQKENANLHGIEALNMDVSACGIDRKVYETLVAEVYFKLGRSDSSCVVPDSSVVPAGLYPVVEIFNGMARVQFIEDNSLMVVSVPTTHLTVLPKIELIPILESGVITRYESHALALQGDGEHEHVCEHDHDHDPEHAHACNHDH